MQSKFKSYLEDVFGLKAVNEADNGKLQGVMQLLIDIRKEAKGKKISLPLIKSGTSLLNWVLP